jgi:N4-(beta-N-acetylglucosaminyl)-L-asparaginase
VDGSVGAAGSTGRGEANLYGLCSLLIVEFLRQGMHPKDAAIEACKRIKANTVEKRLLDRHGNPNFDVTFYVLDAKGRHAGVSLLSGAKYAVCTENGPETLVCEALIERKRDG